jgi:hypothetical protein
VLYAADGEVDLTRAEVARRLNSQSEDGHRFPLAPKAEGGVMALR